MLAKCYALHTYNDAIVCKPDSIQVSVIRAEGIDFDNAC